MKPWLIPLLCCLFVASSRGQDSQFGAFRSAVALAVSASGECIVIDGGTSELLRFSRDGKLLNRIGGYGWSETEFDHPADVICPNALDVYVADYGNHRIQRYDRYLNFVSSLFLRDNDNPDQRFGYPKGVGMSRIGALFITDGENTRMVKIGTSNSVERVFGGVDAGPGRLVNPSRIRVSGSDLVYVQDNGRIAVFDIFGNYITSISGARGRDLRTFTVGGDELYLLDSCSIRVLDRDGKERTQIELMALLDVDECPPVDIAVEGERLYILARTRVVVHRLKF